MMLGASDNGEKKSTFEAPINIQMNCILHGAQNVDFSPTVSIEHGR